MQNVFGGILPPDEKTVDEDFNSAVVVLDTNVLLDLYRYSRKTSEEYLGLIEGLKDQLWMPYQVGFEFLRKRNAIRGSAHVEHGARLEKLREMQKGLENASKRSHLGKDEHEKKFAKALRKYAKHLENELQELRSWGHHHKRDDTLARLVALYGDSVGPEPDEDWLKAARKEGDDRFKLLVPPGFGDVKKPENSLGDFFLWKQCLDFCEKNSRSLVLVTGDAKPDWVDQADGRKMGPRIELALEFNKRTGQRFYLYNPLSFYDKLSQGTALETTTATEARDEVTRLQDLRTRQIDLSHFLASRLKLDPNETGFSRSVNIHVPKATILNEVNLIQEKLRKIADTAAQEQWDNSLTDWVIRRAVATHDFSSEVEDAEVPDDPSGTEREAGSDDQG